jgi:imidazole glycerol-phosphate synthase subunit HisH
MITLVDIGVGNLGSIENMLRKLGCESTISSDPAVIGEAKKIILPGIGSFDHGMRSLRERDLESVLRHKALVEKTPVLGICLGMQMLGMASEEGSEPGLGWIAARSRRFGGEGWDPRLKVPHMGWNAVASAGDNPLLAGLERPRFYFVHSYQVVCDDSSLACGISHYGHDFASMVRQGNIFGAQFHPEKSHRFGSALFRNFMDRC